MGVAAGGVGGDTIDHFCAVEFHTERENILWHSIPEGHIDVLITDGWSKDYYAPTWSLTNEHLAKLGHPRLLPTPPFTIGQELNFDPTQVDNFIGYEQKYSLLAVQRAIILFFLQR